MDDYSKDLQTQFEIIKDAAEKYAQTLEVISWEDGKAKFNEKKKENDSIYYALGFVREHLFPTSPEP